jgi:hypothetical protein
MENCKNCYGKGLVGAGDKPWLQQGPLHTCKMCGGKGVKLGEVVSEVSATPAPEPVEATGTDESFLVGAGESWDEVSSADS